MREDNYILVGTHRVVKDLDRETTRIAAAHSLTFPQFMVLEALLRKDGRSVGEIKDAILSSSGTIPVIINNLVKRGMVRRAEDPTDRRRSLVWLTDAGRVLIEQVCPQNEEMFRERFGVWTQEEKRVLIRLLSKYQKGIAGEVPAARKGEKNA